MTPPPSPTAVIQAHLAAGTAPSFDELVACFGSGATLAVAKPLARTSRFLRVHLDELVSLDHVKAIALVEPEPRPCARCVGRGFVVELDQKRRCPDCDGSGLGLAEGVATARVALDDGTVRSIAFGAAARAREWFETVAATLCPAGK